MSKKPKGLFVRYSITGRYAPRGKWPFENLEKGISIMPKGTVIDFDPDWVVRGPQTVTWLIDGRLHLDVIVPLKCADDFERFVLARLTNKIGYRVVEGMEYFPSLYRNMGGDVSQWLLPVERKKMFNENFK